MQLNSRHCQTIIIKCEMWDIFEDFRIFCGTRDNSPQCGTAPRVVGRMVTPFICQVVCGLSKRCVAAVNISASIWHQTITSVAEAR